MHTRIGDIDSQPLAAVKLTGAGPNPLIEDLQVSCSVGSWIMSFINSHMNRVCVVIELATSYPYIMCPTLCEVDLEVETGTLDRVLTKFVDEGIIIWHRPHCPGPGKAGRFCDEIPGVCTLRSVLIEVLSLHRDDTVRSGFLSERFYTFYAWGQT